MKIRLFFALFLSFLLVFAAACGAAPAAVSVLPEGVTADLDLLAIGENLAYVEVSRMPEYPEEYEGQTVLAKGRFRAFKNPVGEGYLYKILVPDGTGCCTRDLEFIPAGDFTYPDDFPKLDKEITVFGTLTTYERNGMRFATLKNAEIYQ